MPVVARFFGILEEDLPTRAERMVREWGEQHREELAEMWRNKIFRQLPGLE